VYSTGIVLMKERWQSREAKIILVACTIIGIVIGAFFFSQSSGFHNILTAYHEDYVLAQDTSVSAHDIDTTDGYTQSAPVTLIHERIEFLVDVSNLTGGVLHLNFTRDGYVLRTEAVFPWGSSRRQQDRVIVIHDEYRLGYSVVDIIMWATDDDVRISRLYITCHRRYTSYQPGGMGLLFFLIAFFVIIPLIERYRKHTYHGR
jgi:hypothetical protein